MTLVYRSILVASALAASAGMAQAQYYVAPNVYGAAYQQPAPLYPYVVQPQANTGGMIVVAQQPETRAYPYVGARKRAAESRVERKAAKRLASAGKADPVLIEELKQRAAKNPVIKKEIIVREKPIVVGHKRYVDDPPRVVQREIVVDEYHVERPRGLLNGGGRKSEAQVVEPVQPQPVSPLPTPGRGQRVIRAEAEVTILGPDRMSIRLFRKRGEPAPSVAED
jgi:hypothetical protein